MFPPISILASANGDGGGLCDLERRASSCRKGIGENIGVVGVDCDEPVGNVPIENPFWGNSAENASHVDVTRSDFSTARRYLPMNR